MPPHVLAVHKSRDHSFSKTPAPSIRLIAGLGVDGDAHAGTTVQHRSRVAKDPSQPNLRQVHLLHAELHDALNAAGFDVIAGGMGENVTTRGVDLLALPRGTRLHIGSDVLVEVTGLRNPCKQLDDYRRGLMKAVLDRTTEGQLVRKAGIMAIVLNGGEIRADDAIVIRLPDEAHRPLEPV